MENYLFEITMKVRDYECDLQGIVNNANYLHYMEHTRHEFLVSLGESFADLHNKGMDAVVSRVDIEYKASLTGGDTFISKLNMVKKGPKVVFYQCILREIDRKICASGKVEAVILQNGKLTRGEYFDELISKIDDRLVT